MTTSFSYPVPTEKCAVVTPPTTPIIPLRAWKLRLVRLMNERGYSRAVILELFRVIDWMIRLADGLGGRFLDDVNRQVVLWGQAAAQSEALISPAFLLPGRPPWKTLCGHTVAT